MQYNNIMEMINLEINLSKYENHTQIVADLTKGYAATNGDTVYMTIDLLSNGFIFGDHLAILVVFVNYLRSNGVVVTGKFINFDMKHPCIIYASRIDFFNSIDIPLTESFERQDGTGRFIEITSFKDTPSVIDLNKRITQIFYNNALIQDKVLKLVDYCINEIMDNVITHAFSPVHGWAYAQLLPSDGVIRLVFVDAGTGIYEQLSKDDEYSNLKPYQTIIKCTQKGVTSRRKEGNQGNGLFHTTEFIKRNRGDLILHSGAFSYIIDNGISKVITAPLWKGTYLFMRVNLNIDVEYEEVIGGGYDLDNSFDFYYY